MSGETCVKCKKKISENEDSLKYSGMCSGIFHPKCINITSRQLEVITNCNGLKWFCDGCIFYTDFISKVTNELENLKVQFQSELNDLKSTIKGRADGKKENSLSVSKPKSFAEVAAEEVVIIKPRNNQECKKTIEAIQKNLKPASLEVGITELKNIKEGGVVIKCKSKEEQEIIKKAAEKKLNKNYEIKAPNLKNPCIKVVDIDDNLSGDELLKLIKKQNTSVLHDNSELRVKVIKKMKTKFMAIIESDPNTFKKIMDQNYLFIDWSKCRVFEYVSVYRCFKCGGFDHHIESCKSQTKCLKCTSLDHITENCESNTPKCYNCIEIKQKLKIEIDVNHSIFDITCPVYLRKVENQKKKINNTSFLSLTH